MSTSTLMNKVFRVTAEAAAFLGVASLGMGHVEATTIMFTSRTDWNNAVSRSTVFLEDFERFTADTPFRNTPIDLGDFTLTQVGRNTFFRNLIDVSPFLYEDNNGTNHASLFIKFGQIQVNMTFTTPIFAWGADFFGAEGESSEKVDLNLILDMGELFTTIPVTISDGFFGFVTTPTETIRQVTFTARYDSGGFGGEGFGIDNVVGAKSLLASEAVPESVPEPTSMVGLLTLGVLGAESASRHKKNESD